MQFIKKSQLFTLITIFESITCTLWFSSYSSSVCGQNETFVDCRSKNLTGVPKFPNLPPTITRMDFSFNDIKIVHSIDVPQPSSITEISFSHNIIETFIKGVFNNISSLQTLDLSYNKFTGSALHTKPFFLEIGHAKRLILRGNDLGMVNDNTFSPLGISNVEYLDLSHCSLKSIGYMSIHNLGSLSFLNLSYNLLTNFEDVLPGEIRLEILDLGYNKILAVKKLPALLSLTYLYMDYNGIVYIKDGVFSSLLSLKVLSLKGNNLKTLQPHVLPLGSLFVELKDLRLDKNPWRCDCNMKWLLVDNDDEIIFRNFTLRCTYPSRLRRKNIFDVSSSDLTCAEAYSRLTYILILFFTACFMVAGTLYLFYLIRKKLSCCHRKGGNYMAVYTNDDADADEGANVKFTRTDNESLVNNEERPVAENRRVQYFDV